MDYWRTGLPIQHSRGGTEEIYVKPKLCYSLFHICFYRLYQLPYIREWILIKVASTCNLCRSQ